MYLSQKHRFAEAFVWIDRAISMTDDKYFSIRNSHAIILFNANIDKIDGNVREQLDRSMQILERCIKNDSRKRFHACVYADQAIRYFSKYNDDIAKDYIRTARNWLFDIVKKRNWEDECKKALKKLDDLISTSDF